MEKINKIYRRILRMHMDKEYQRKIKNKDCSIISMNCVGGMVSHELGLRFNSPTVNLWFTPKEFIKFLSQFWSIIYMIAKSKWTRKTVKNTVIRLEG